MNKPSHTAQRIVIVGGGVTGLSIACRLAQSGLPVTVFESAQVGVTGASTRNQGWMHSGAWFAPFDVGMARMCHESLEQTLRFCPECVEPHSGPMAFVVSRLSTLHQRYLHAWREAGIPYEDWPLADLFAQAPQLDPISVQYAFRLPDRVFRPEVLLTHLAAAAQNAGVEIRQATTVVSLMQDDDTATGVVTATGEPIRARLVVLAGNAAGASLWPVSDEAAAVGQSIYQRVALKTHLAAVQPAVAPVPLCVLDVDGFNHLPHGRHSVFGTSRWLPVADPQDHAVVSAELDRLWQCITRFFPACPRTGVGHLEWAGTTIQAMHVDQTEPGQAPRPTVIDHARESPRVENLLSAFPGRATLWPHLAEDCRRLVLQKIGQPPIVSAPPMWGTPAATAP